MRQFIETSPKYKNERITKSDIYRCQEGIENEVKKSLIEFVWHRLEKVKEMYRDTLGVNFLGNLGPLFKAVKIRHDIVHRNGRTIDGEEILIFGEEVKELISEVEGLVRRIDDQIADNSVARA